ncbi:hypothetical protein [Qipengyuania sp.]|uniref:hypothetical protein n=1 Tax=Qipengyuania sp. TaxID=2004515 RepID=UPI003AF718A3
MKGAPPRRAAIFRQANIADLIILTPFAIPVVSDYYLALWRILSEAIAPGRPLGTFAPDAMLFVNLTGAFAVLAVVLRIKLGSPQAAWMTVVFKLFATTIFAVALLRGASPVFAVPLVADLAVGILLVASSRKD